MSRHPFRQNKKRYHKISGIALGVYKNVTAAQFQALLRLYSRVTPDQRMTDSGHLAPVNKS